MARLIDADNVESVLLAICERESGIPLAVAEWLAGAVRNAPTVDAVPVVHGRWDTILKKTVSRLSRCSACGFEKYNIHWCNYCPNCGAKMDLEVE